MDPAALADVRVIVAHDECADGTASAILLHDALPGAEIVFCDYGAPARQLAARPGMLFCDFSPPAARADEFVAAGAMVLDHHRSARPVIERFGERGVFGDERADPGVSGAMLAYRHVWLALRAGAPEQPFAAWFAAAAGARDTWQTASPLWRDGCVQHALLTAFDNTFWLATPLAALARDWPTATPGSASSWSPAITTASCARSRLRTASPRAAACAASRSTAWHSPATPPSTSPTRSTS
jgi:hypothetical protein